MCNRIATLLHCECSKKYLDITIKVIAISIRLLLNIK